MGEWEEGGIITMNDTGIASRGDSQTTHVTLLTKPMSLLPKSEKQNGKPSQWSTSTFQNSYGLRCFVRQNTNPHLHAAPDAAPLMSMATDVNLNGQAAETPTCTLPQMLYLSPRWPMMSMANDVDGQAAVCDRTQTPISTLPQSHALPSMSMAIDVDGH